MWKLIRYSMEMRRTQSVATLLTVCVTVAATFVLLLAYRGAALGMQAASERLGADLMVVPAQAAAVEGSSALLFTSAPVDSYLDGRLVERIAGAEGVERVSAQFFGKTLDSSCCSSSTPTRLIGYDAASDWVIGSWAGTGAEPLGQGRVIVGSDVDGYGTGSGFLLGSAVEVEAVLPPTGTDLDGSIIADIDVVRALAEQEADFAGLWERFGPPATLVSAVLVRVGEESQDAVAAQLSGLEGAAVISSADALGSAQREMGGMLRILSLAAAALLVASVLQLFARFYSLAWERRGELALYRALGAGKRDLAKLIGGEAAVLVGSGLVAGLVLGALLSLALPAFVNAQGAFPFIAPPVHEALLSALAISAALALLGSLAVAAPLRQSAKISPARAMLAGDID